MATSGGRPVLDRIIQAAAGLVVALIPVAAVQWPQLAPWLVPVAGAITYLVGRMPPSWDEPLMDKA